MKVQIQIGTERAVFLPVSITEKRVHFLKGDNPGGSGDRKHVAHALGGKSSGQCGFI